MAPDLGRRPSPIGRRGLVLLAILGAAFWAAWELDLGLQELVPRRGGLALAGRFLAGAFAP
ncbi:MAG: hypothetical protein ACYTG6_14830, partial [Planctomycetota bacterium]